MIIGAKRREIVGAGSLDHQQVPLRRDRSAIGKGKVDSLRELGARQIQGVVRAGVMQFDVFITRSARRVGHELSHPQIILQHRRAIWFTRGEFNWRRPVTPTSVGILHAHPNAIGVPHFGQIGWKSDRVRETGHLRAFPIRLDFIFSRIVGIEGRLARRRHLRQPPLQRGKTAAGSHERRGPEGQPVHRVIGWPFIARHRRPRNGRIEGPTV